MNTIATKAAIFILTAGSSLNISAACSQPVQQVYIDPRRLLTHDAEKTSCLGDDNQGFVAISELPPHLVAAFVTAWDSKFFDRPTLDAPTGVEVLTGQWFRKVSPILKSVAQSCQGIVLSRDLKQALFLYEIELYVPKIRILELLLNTQYLGRHSYGVSSAAKAYFGKSLSGLKIEEAAYIAILPASSYLSSTPRESNQVARRDAERLIRWNDLLYDMARLGKITAKEAEFAHYQPVIVKPDEKPAEYDGDQSFLFGRSSR